MKVITRTNAYFTYAVQEQHRQTQENVGAVQPQLTSYQSQPVHSTSQLAHAQPVQHPSASPQPQAIANPSYQRLQDNFETVITTLSPLVRAEDLADKLFSARMINPGLLEEAGVTAVANSKRIRPLIVAVLSQVKTEPEKLTKFVEILQQFEGLEGIVKILN